MAAPIVNQSWAMSAVLCSMLGLGMVLSYPTSLLPGLQSQDSTIQVNMATASWLASSIALACGAGFLFTPFFMAYYGRRLTHALGIIPGVVGWVTIYWAHNVTTLMIGRILGGITIGATALVGVVAVGEYTSPEHRGMFLNLKTAAVCLGSTLVHILGHYYHWRTVALCGLVPYILAFVIVCTWPESPSWLVWKGDLEKSKKAFVWLRGSSEKSKKEYNRLVEAQKSNFKSKETVADKIREFFRKFGRKDFVKPCVIVVFGIILLESCGRHFFPAYATAIIGEITGDKTQSFLYTLYLDLIITISSVSSSIIIRMMKRRTLVFLTGITSLVFLSCVVVYLFLVHKALISNEHTWVPMTMLIIYFVIVNLGCIPISVGFQGELFPLAHRGIGPGFSGIIASVYVTIPLKITPYLLSGVGLHGMFVVYGATAVISLLVLYFMLPETKDKTLQEIEDYFNHGKFEVLKRNDDDEERKDDEARLKMIE